MTSQDCRLLLTIGHRRNIVMLWPMIKSTLLNVIRLQDLIILWQWREKHHET